MVAWIGDQLHVMVAGVIKSFDTVDRTILDCTLGRLGLPDWFWKAYLLIIVSGGIPQDCPLSMVFIGVLSVPWCRRLEAMPALRPQLRADNLKCCAKCPGALFDAARFTTEYVRTVGQDVSPGKCVLISTSKAVSRAMKHWDISEDGKAWQVKLDVRDLGGHLALSARLELCPLGSRSGSG